jgi:predicted nucleic acid binding AN1-type Zn finger protein
VAIVGVNAISILQSINLNKEFDRRRQEKRVKQVQPVYKQKKAAQGQYNEFQRRKKFTLFYAKRKHLKI